MIREVKGNKVTVKIACMECHSISDMLAWTKRYVKESKIKAEVTVDHLVELKVHIIRVILVDTDLIGTRTLRERLAALAAGYCLRFEMTVSEDKVL